MPLAHADVVTKLNQIADTALVQLVYVSSLTLRSRLSTTIFEDIESKAREYNERNFITGALCYGNGHFLQCVEGEKSKVSALLERILADERHQNIEVLLLQTVEQRSFTDWRMRMVFLERWLWSPATKQQADQLSPYLPFVPHGWSFERTEQFLEVIKTFENHPHVNATGITYNALGNMVRHIAAPHQAFWLFRAR